MFYLFDFSSDVRQHLRECFGDHPEVVLGYGALSHADVKGEGVHKVPPDPKSSEAEAGGVFPACVDVHEWNRYEFRAERIPRVPTS